MLKLMLQNRQLKAALTHAAVGDIRYYLNGVMVECTKDNILHIVATDGHRMFVGRILTPDWIEEPQNGPWNIIIPSEVIKRACTPNKGSVWLVAREDGRYELGDVTFSAIDGVFPDWRRVSCVGKSLNDNTPFDTEYLADATKAMQLWYDNKKQYWWHTYEGGIGRMTGSDDNTFIIVMNVRLDTMPNYVAPFVPTPYKDLP